MSLNTSKQTVEPGQIVTFTVNIRNNNGRTASGVTASLTLHSDLEFKSASNDGRERRNAVEWEDLTIPGGGSISLNASAEVSDEVSNDDDIFIAAFAAGRADEVKLRVNDEDAIDNDSSRNLNVSLESSNTSIEAGDVFTYTVRIRNSNDRRVSKFNASLTLDDNLSYLSSSNGGANSDGVVEWTELDIDGNTSRELIVSVEASDDLKENDSIESTITIEGSVDKLRLNIEDRNRGQERIALYAFTEEDEIAIDDDISYTIHLRNEEQEDQVIKVLAHLDHSSKFVSASDDGLQLERYMVEWQDIEIPQNETKTINLVVKADPKKAYHGSFIQTVIAAGGFESRHIRTRVTNPERVAEQAALEEQQPVSNIIDPQGIIAASQQEQPQPTTQETTPVQPNSEEASPTETQQVVERPTPRTLAQIDQETTSSTEEQQTGAAAISINKSASADEAKPGGTVEFTVTIQNDGNASAENITVIDRFTPDTVEISPASNAVIRNDSIQWRIASIEAGDSWQTTYEVTIDEEVSHGETIKSTLSAAGDFGQSTEDDITNTAVIDRLPRTGIGAFSIASLQRNDRIRNGTFQANMVNSQNETLQNPLPKFSVIVAILLAATGLIGGSMIAKRLSHQIR